MKPDCNDCCSPQITNAAACGCCEGVEIITPESTYNRPGLSAINYRIGSHSSFLETMTARLTGFCLENSDELGQLKKQNPLQGLTTRDGSDPALAMLDAWATVADVLTFYQERIANEGYLRTATERRSILELARLVGYKPRPGVSSSVFLAYNIDDNFKEGTTIPVGSRAQSIPGPDDLPQSFETSENLMARAQWNNLKPRLSQPQIMSTIHFGTPGSTISGPRIYLKGVTTNLKVNDPLLISFSSATPVFHQVQEVRLDPESDRTLVILQGGSTSIDESLANFNLLNDLALNPSVPTRNSLRLKRYLTGQFTQKASSAYKMVSSFTPRLKNILGVAAANAKLTQDSEIKVYVLRTTASLFGHNFPRRFNVPSNGGTVTDAGDWPIIQAFDSLGGNIAYEEETRLFLDATYDSVKKGSWLVIQTPQTRLTDKKTLVVKVAAVDSSVTRAKYGSSAASTQIDIDFSLTTEQRWINIEANRPTPSLPFGDDFDALRSTTVYTQAEELELAEEPIETPICGGTDELIELDDFYEDLESGRWVIVSGEREIAGTSGVRSSELAMISTVTQDVIMESPGSSGVSESFSVLRARPHEKIHTFIKLAEKLAYCFKRDTVTIHGNVVKATHGETRHEVLGSGNGATPFQSFELKQFPLTHVSASNPSGVDSTLAILVNDLNWREADSLAELQENDRRFITKTDNDEKTAVIFGNGKKGARLPTGSENIRAIYRNGIGKSGNVKEQQISLLMSKPLGVKEVINPLRASGGANRETRDQARKHVPLAVKALDRLVSVQDYEDFSRIYAGIGKAHAMELTNGRQQLVHVTVAGAEDIPIDPSSDLFRNLRRALHDFGDPHQAIQLAVRELMFMVIEAGVAILPDYQWESVVTDLRQQLLDAFSFERRELGQDVLLSEVMQVMQSVRGIAYVDVNAFGGVPEKRALTVDDIDELQNSELPVFYDRQILSPDEITDEVANTVKTGLQQILRVNTPRLNQLNLGDGSVRKHIQPAQLAYLTPEGPATLILNQIEGVS